ncbi:hypothetical protein BpHYR1_029348 [Brachionus plicatilis]|uniref:Uncharacterized protein n=1 Tax=Brachionus plicatilis TaxID=10195 RepID=A0A3M7RT60_BRAPC|nr:hypothetical protein BpHYR1_029348 [Brachionus plicatilis]
MTQLITSDDDNADFLDDHNFLDEFDQVDDDKEKILFEEEVDDINQHVIDSIESTINRKSGPTSYATTNIDNTKLSPFIMIFDIFMLNLIVQCTNSIFLTFKNLKFVDVNLSPPVLRALNCYKNVKISVGRSERGQNKAAKNLDR